VKSTLLTVLGIALFTALLAYLTLRDTGISCEVCMTWDGRTACMTVVAEAREQAITQARNNACGILTQGMAAELACQRMTPTTVVCEP
jgi:hypothetical protein